MCISFAHNSVYALESSELLQQEKTLLKSLPSRRVVISPVDTFEVEIRGSSDCHGICEKVGLITTCGAGH